MLYSEQNDETLVTLTLTGDHKAYEVLVLRHQRAVLTSAYAITHSNYMAEDAAQDAFVTAWMKLNMLRDPSKYCSWVCRIAQNCAKDMLVRFSEYIPFDLLENLRHDGHSLDEALISSKESETLRDSVEKLPKKVRQVIYLHYFEGLSIAEIATRMLAPVGTVKWQLHEGRHKLRKDLCAMNENENDTLVAKVMKKVEELKLWKMKNSKRGFDKVYEEVLSEVESLPESIDKQHALADTLMRGWWWLPGKKNDALLTRIKESAILGGNDEIIGEIIYIEDEKLSGDAKLEFMLKTQIPFLEKHGFTKALGKEWFWLGHAYFKKGDSESGFAAFEKVLSILTPKDVYYACTLSAQKVEKLRGDKLSSGPLRRYSIAAFGESYRFIGGELRFWSQPGYSHGHFSDDITANYVLYNASLCDGHFTIPNAKVGDVYTATDGSTLTFAENNATVETPCGIFDGCEVWVIHKVGYKGMQICTTCFKRGVGIVRQEFECGNMKEVRMLLRYTLLGGDGILPCHAGNIWEYCAGYLPEKVAVTIQYEMTYADKNEATFSVLWSRECKAYDQNSWNEMALKLHDDYTCFDKNGDDFLVDVFPDMQRLKELAKTPYEIAHTKAACDTMSRILMTNPDFNPKHTQYGLWNFFENATLSKEDGKTLRHVDRSYSFEWKEAFPDDASLPLLYNDILGILQDAVGCIWCDDFAPGRSSVLERQVFDDTVTTEYSLRDIGTVTTAAGSFDNCIELSLDIKGMQNGWAYRGGKKEYIFAPGIGIIRTVTHYKNNTLTAVYELTSYIGEGEGYMPLFEGMMRRYEAIGLTGGYIAFSEYTFERDARGFLTAFENRCGVRDLPKE